MLCRIYNATGGRFIVIYNKIKAWILCNIICRYPSFKMGRKCDSKNPHRQKMRYPDRTPHLSLSILTICITALISSLLNPVTSMLRVSVIPSK